MWMEKNKSYFTVFQMVKYEFDGGKKNNQEFSVLVALRNVKFLQGECWYLKALFPLSKQMIPFQGSFFEVWN